MANANPTRHVGKQIKVQPHEVDNNGNATGITSGNAIAITCAPLGPNYRVGVEYIICNYRTSPTNGSIQISDGTTTIGPFGVGVGMVQIKPPRPLLFGKGATVTVTIADGSVTKDAYVAFTQDGGDGGV